MLSNISNKNITKKDDKIIIKQNWSKRLKSKEPFIPYILGSLFIIICCIIFIQLSK